MKDMNNNNLTEEKFLAEYDPSQYERPSVTVDMLVFSVMDKKIDNYRKLPEKELKILMVKRGEHPYKGEWALPGGFVKMEESLDKAAYRELKEETNVDNLYLEQLYAWGEVNRDPRTRIISSSYMALVDGSKMEVSGSDDAEEAKWFSLISQLKEEKKSITSNGYVLERKMLIELRASDEHISSEVLITKTIENNVTRIKRQVVSSEGIAFDHGIIIYYGLERLRSKIEFTDITFNLMPKLFSLTELQNVYEVILDRELLAANFRRKIARYVEETNEVRKDAGHRPSKLYRFKQSDINNFY